MRSAAHSSSEKLTWPAVQVGGGGGGGSEDGASQWPGAGSASEQRTWPATCDGRTARARARHWSREAHGAARRARRRLEPAPAAHRAGSAAGGAPRCPPTRRVHQVQGVALAGAALHDQRHGHRLEADAARLRHGCREQGGELLVHACLNSVLLRPGTLAPLRGRCRAPDVRGWAGCVRFRSTAGLQARRACCTQLQRTSSSTCSARAALHALLVRRQLSSCPPPTPAHLLVQARVGEAHGALVGLLGGAQRVRLLHKHVHELLGEDGWWEAGKRRGSVSQERG